jgi:hypothetical protein
MDAAATGVVYTNRVSPAQIARNRLSEDGSGVAAGDVDGDGWCDLYVCGLETANALFRNRGDWTFEDITARAGVACEGQLSTGAVLADLDGDGDLDLLVNGLGAGTRCFLNRGGGRFEEPKVTGLERSTGSRSLALADVDGDGDLDVYVTNYRATTVRDSPIPVRVRRVGGRWEVPVEHRDRFIAEPSVTARWRCSRGERSTCCTATTGRRGLPRCRGPRGRFWTRLASRWGKHLVIGD